VTDWPSLARALHVLAIVHWIGGLYFVTFVILPALLERAPSERLGLFDALERRFAAQARISTALAGFTGFYLLDAFGHWTKLLDPRFWWLDAMIALWALFKVMLYIAEPLFLHALFDSYARRNPDRAFRVALAMHRVLSFAALATIVGAVGGAHGLF